MGITYEALFSSRGTKLGAPASSLRSEGAYESRRPVPKPVFLLEEFGIERGQREAPTLCDPLLVMVHSWPQPASREPCLSPPAWYLESRDPQAPQENHPAPTAIMPLSIKAKTLRVGRCVLAVFAAVCAERSVFLPSLTHTEFSPGSHSALHISSSQSGAPAPGDDAQSCLGTSCGCHIDGALGIQG